jgi:hypothetical protein
MRVGQQTGQENLGTEGDVVGRGEQLGVGKHPSLRSAGRASKSAPVGLTCGCRLNRDQRCSVAQFKIRVHARKEASQFIISKNGPAEANIPRMVEDTTAERHLDRIILVIGRRDQQAGIDIAAELEQSIEYLIRRLLNGRNIPAALAPPWFASVVS